MKLTKEDVLSALRVYNGISFKMPEEKSDTEIQSMLKKKVTLEDMFVVFDVLSLPTMKRLNDSYQQVEILTYVVDTLAHKLDLDDEQLDSLYEDGLKHFEDTQAELKKEQQNVASNMKKDMKKNLDKINKK